ncbi:AgmX/PglI C-terminal domain-containing protein [uncultured Desulfuromusa sp.]|uniref:AgmX/PglI C-terminal domain-containing protein n=1 Tax=uncultured Desulfuromusa sp. TaxID=219183 RepID=UPI002AA84F3E|nr:AgmX/PglI C-terminal domain-containing protein [uncultured Desulfuromusa sp.]
MDISILSQELEPLNLQIEQLQETVVTLENDLRIVEAELDTFAIDQQHFEILQDACDALDKLQELGADELFWEGVPEMTDTTGHSGRVRARLAAFEEQTRDLREKKEFLQRELDQHLGFLDDLFDEVEQAHDREQRRQEEFVIEREISILPYRAMIMPWSKEVESEKRFRQSLLVSMLWAIILCVAISLVTVPIPDRVNVVAEIPERLAMLLKQEPPPLIPAPIEAPVQVAEKSKNPEKPEPEQKQEVPQEKKAKPEKTLQKKQQQVKPAGGGGTKGAKKKAENLGVLAFKSSFSDLMDKVPVAKLGVEANLDKKIPGQARVQRSLVTAQAQGGGSKGIRNFGVSRNLGTGGQGGGSGYGNAGQIGGIGTGKVESAMAGLAEEAGRPLSDGIGAARTEEEIQIVFDRYKATLYRIYNKELRKDPTLQGKLLLHITIEPSGEVSLCRMVATDLNSPELVAKIVARVKRFNFGPKEDVPSISFDYPIDFLPAG